MEKVGIILFKILARLLSLLPLRVLYAISDFNRLLIYFVFHYRRKVVETNLKNAFPEKSEAERKNIEWRFYQHLCDLFIEEIYLMYTSRKKAIKLLTLKNPEVLEKYYNEGRSVVATGGHYGNWELYSILPVYLKFKVIGAFKTIQNSEFEQLMNNTRSRFGSLPVQMHDIARESIKMYRNGEKFFLGLINDQTPARGDIRFWTKFLNQQTAVFLGAEKLAVKLNLPVVFCNMRKLKRGRYEVEFRLLEENPKDTKPYEITKLHVKALEELIREKPEYWLWSHKRWKYKPKDVKVSNVIN